MANGKKIKIENYSWETSFDTANNLMTHTMTDRVSVISNIKTGMIKLFKDGCMIASIQDPTITEYEKWLLSTAKIAHELKNLSNNDNT